MKGNNELHLNEATMIEAVQYWLNSRFVNAAPVVHGISGGKDSYSKIFVVSVKEAPHGTEAE